MELRRAGIGLLGLPEAALRLPKVSEADSGAAAGSGTPGAWAEVHEPGEVLGIDNADDMLGAAGFVVDGMRECLRSMTLALASSTGMLEGKEKIFWRGS